MSTYTTIEVTNAEGVATIALNRPDAMNSFDDTMRAELADALRRAANEDDVRVVVLTGNGRAFSAGADLKAGLPAGEYSVREQLNVEYKPCFDAINKMGKPVIASVNGSAAGIGLSFALTCDLIIMSEKAFFLSPFTTISLVGDGGANWLLTQKLGYQKAFELSVFSERIDAQTALAHGLVNSVCAAEDLGAKTSELATRLLARAPLSLAATKQAMRFSMSHDFDQTFALESELQKSLVGCEDNIEGVEAFFGKRTPTFVGK